jgi:hypothetical protein
MASTDWKSEVPSEERKRRLLAEGALFRIGLMEGRSTVRASLDAQSMAKGALSRIAGAVSSMAGGNFFGKGSSMQSLLSLLIGGISLLPRRHLRKPLLYGSIISAGVVVACYLSRRQNKARNAGVAGAAEVSTQDGE